MARPHFLNHKSTAHHFLPFGVPILSPEFETVWVLHDNHYRPWTEWWQINGKECWDPSRLGGRELESRPRRLAIPIVA